nr:disulfide bond corrector protein DsbC [uncultured bacterium]
MQDNTTFSLSAAETQLAPELFHTTELIMPYLLSLILLSFSFSVQAFFSNQQDFLPVEEAFQLQMYEAAEGGATLHWSVTPGHYLYQHSISATDATGNTIELEIPEGLENEDEFFGVTQIYRTDLLVPISLEQPQPYSVTWQGCADAGLCYPPQTTELSLSSAAGAASASTDVGLAKDQSIAEQLASAGMLANLAAFFLMGVLLAFTPCMLPMLPILSSVIAGSKPGGWQGARLGAAFVLSMSLVYAVLGVIAAQLGGSMAAALQNPWLLLPFAGLFILLALAQFGLYSLQLPAFIRARLHQTDQKIKGGSLLGAAALGVLSALLVGPCMTAPLAGGAAVYRAVW